MKRILMVAVSVAVLCALSACGGQEQLAEARPETHPSETVETLAVLTTSAAERETKSTTTEALTVRLAAETTTTVVETTAEPTEAPTEAPTNAPEVFVLSDTEVAEKMHDFFSEKGYTDAQIAGIVGNAEIESGLEPSRGVSGGGFGLFQLMDCEQRREMFAAFDAQGVGKYATSDYWAFGASDFDSAEDFDTYMDVLLDYTMNPDDPAWMEELASAETPEEAAEVFLVHYERAVGGSSPIEYYAPYSGLCYQATGMRRESARRWYEYFTA